MSSSQPAGRRPSRRPPPPRRASAGRRAPPPPALPSQRSSRPSTRRRPIPWPSASDDHAAAAAGPPRPAAAAGRPRPGLAAPRAVAVAAGPRRAASLPARRRVPRRRPRGSRRLRRPRVPSRASPPPSRPSFRIPRLAEPSAGRAEYQAPPNSPTLRQARLRHVRRRRGPPQRLNQCEQFFRGQRTLASDRTWLASYHLRGAAQTCRLAELGRLAFTTTVQDFADRFQALACHAPGVTGQQRAELFIGGLPDHIRVDVEMRDPQDLQSAMYYARAFEQRARAMQQAFPASDVRPADRPPPTPPGQALTAVTHAGHSEPAATRPFRRLTTAEQLERRRKGLCFNCDELYVPGHVCPRLFYLETVDDIAADVVAAGLADAAVSQADTAPG
ncbi:hypothetical protein QYE76_030668 [Lolium multiflorum]|uniref:Retrotransposon gag domain-containing protein n=1 Tax=Lolium multiflorum TaxID=4521 RepID=A0AAD8VJG3_LOLMU|nr:hypothetical protein QYE76_030668 [Lolium multiflorum]